MWPTRWISGTPRRRWTEVERFVFAAFYETLVRIDCEGRALPALAAQWANEDGGRRWRFTLRSDARFWDGGPVTAEDVVAAWSERSAGFASVSVTDARTLTIELAYRLALEADSTHEKAAANLTRIDGHEDGPDLPPLDLPSLGREFLQGIKPVPQDTTVRLAIGCS